MTESIYSTNILKKNIERLNTMEKSIKKFVDGESVKYNFDTLFYNLKDIFANIYNSLSESAYFNYNDCDNYNYQLQSFIEKIMSFETLENKENCEKVLEIIEYTKNILSSNDIKRLIDSSSPYISELEFTYFTTDYNQTDFGTIFLKDFFKNIKSDRELNVLLYANQHPANVDAILEDKRANLYCALLDSRCYYRHKKDSIKRIILGAKGKTMITNNCFDVVFGIVPTQLMTRNVNVTNPYDYDYVSKLVSYTAPNGIISLIMPAFRLTKNICSFLSKYLKDVEIYKIKYNNNKKKIVIITGIKKDSDFEVDPEIFNKLRYYHMLRPSYFYDIWDGTEREFSISYPLQEVKMFRGSLISDDDINEMFEESEANNEFWKNQHQELISEYRKRPLLPFNIGHLGLVLTSGCLDGVVEEKDGYSHLVKGRIVKVKNKEELDVDNGSIGITIEETTSNQVEINLFLSDGTYKSLI